MAPIHYRIAGNAVTLALQSTNSAIMLSALLDEGIMKDPDVQTMASMMLRFFTVWNVIAQMLYASLALVCDLSTLAHRNHLLPKNIEKIRNFYFSALVFPGTLMVFTLFWPIYIYDRELIFPAFIDKAFSQNSGFVIHLAIVPSVLWELAYQPRERPKSHVINVLVGSLYYLVYNVLIYHTYFKRGVWPYNLMGIVYNGPQIYHCLLHAYIYSLIISVYLLQWRLKDYFWEKEERKKKK